MFAHIYFMYHPELNQGGIFRYKYWSVFFASMMYPVLFFVFGYLVQRLVNIYVLDKRGKRYGNILVGTLYAFSLFYFGITFFPYDRSYARIGLNPLWYYVIAIISTISIVLIIVYLPQRLKIQVVKLRFALETIIAFCLKWRKDIPFDKRVDYTEEFFKATKEAGVTGE